MTEIIEIVSFPGGKHCETTTLGALLRHVGIDLSEPMLFGLGAGLGFAYWDAKTMAFPFLGGRIKPAALTRNLASRLGLTMQAQETTSVRAAWRNVAAAIDAGSPVGLQLDSYHLDYFTTRIHFGAHFVAMYGYDDTYAYLVETAQQGGTVRTTRKSLELARGERGPMTARNLSYTVAAAGGLPDLGEVVAAAIRSNASDFLNPPIANLGHRGIRKAAGQVTKWLERSADPRRDLTLAHRRYAEIAPLWTRVAAHIAAAGETGEEHHLRTAATILLDLAEREREAMQALAGVGT